LRRRRRAAIDAPGGIPPLTDLPLFAGVFQELTTGCFLNAFDFLLR
jgi:hypothetical protein